MFGGVSYEATQQQTNPSEDTASSDLGVADSILFVLETPSLELLKRKIERCDWFIILPVCHVIFFSFQVRQHQRRVRYLLYGIMFMYFLDLSFRHLFFLKKVHHATDFINNNKTREFSCLKVNKLVSRYFMTIRRSILN